MRRTVENMVRREGQEARQMRNESDHSDKHWFRFVIRRWRRCLFTAAFDAGLHADFHH